MTNDIGTYECYREKLVKGALTDCISKGGEYDPFTADNLHEALNELPANVFDSLIKSCNDVRNSGLINSDIDMAKIGKLIYVAIYTYWENQAIEYAEESIPSIDELIEDDRCESSCDKYESARFNEN